MCRNAIEGRAHLDRHPPGWKFFLEDTRAVGLCEHRLFEGQPDFSSIDIEGHAAGPHQQGQQLQPHPGVVEIPGRAGLGIGRGQPYRQPGQLDAAQPVDVDLVDERAECGTAVRAVDR